MSDGSAAAADSVNIEIQPGSSTTTSSSSAATGTTTSSSNSSAGAGGGDATGSGGGNPGGPKLSALGGCGCRTAPEPAGAPLVVPLAGLAALLLRRRRARRAPR